MGGAGKVGGMLGVGLGEEGRIGWGLVGGVGGR